MSVLTKPLEDITVADLQDLVDRSARESGELEFKGMLPFKPQKGQPETEDRWITRGDRVGDYARDQLLAELVSFANADGGTLILGLHESADEPKRAARLEPLPRCEDLARRLVDACEDIIEPRLPLVLGRGLPINEQGAGYVVLRVGRSFAAPHRLRSDGQFYVRRGERAATMTVREIKDLTLEMARTGDRLEEAFQERRAESAELFKKLKAAKYDDQNLIVAPLVVRATALPTTPQRVPQLTGRQDLWWLGGPFNFKVGDANVDCPYPAREFTHQPRIRLRGFTSVEADDDDEKVRRVLLDSGLVEFQLVHGAVNKTWGTGEGKVRLLYVGWIIGLLTGLIGQVDKLRSSLAWDTVEFGLEVEILSTRPLALLWRDSHSSGRTLDYVLPLRLPRYVIGDPATYDALISDVVVDLWNAWGSAFNTPCQIPWDRISR